MARGPVRLRKPLPRTTPSRPGSQHLYVQQCTNLHCKPASIDGSEKKRGAIAFLIAAECVLSEIAREVRVRGSFGEQLARGVQEQSEIRMLLFGNVGFS